MFPRLTPMVKSLLIVTIAAYFIPQLLGWNDINFYLGLWSLGSDYFMPHQFFTYMFAHGSFWHIFGNMLGLFFLGAALEQFWGSKRFLIFYMVTGIGAGVLYEAIKYVQVMPMKSRMEEYIANPNPDDFAIYMAKYSPQHYNGLYDFIEYYSEHPLEGKRQSISYVEQAYNGRINIPMVGASGAIYAILMAFGLLFPNTTMIIFPLPIPIKAKYLVLGAGGYVLFKLFSNTSGDQVAHLAHLTGMIFGYIMIRIWSKGKNNFY